VALYIHAVIFVPFIHSWKEVVQKDCQARNSNKEDAMDHDRWRKLIKIG